MTRLQVCAALVLGFAVMTLGVSQAAERTFADGPQWPDVPSDKLPVPNPHPAFLDPDEVTARILRPKAGDLDADVTGSVGGDPQWPDLPPEKLPAPNSKPAFAAPGDALARAQRPKSEASASAPTPEATTSAAQWPQFQPLPSQFAFETGARYWYSSGKVRFAFRNGDPAYGDPTSTLDWKGMTAHSGEVFARIDHRPTGWFVKGLAGLGKINGGDIEDRDFLAGQFKFSDTTSDVNKGDISYAMIDIGWAYSPVGGTRIGFFAGYHYWREKMSAYGIVCNQASIFVAGCPAAGAVPVGYDTQVFQYQPTWNAFRIGFEAKFALTDRWSFSGELAAIPYASLQNKDSHLLRQSPDDFGPAPNVITESSYAYGLEAEFLINYAITPNIEFGGGARYWGLVSRYGGVRAGPTFAIRDTVTNFDQQRYGVIAQLKVKF